jgi:Putative adhesin
MAENCRKCGLELFVGQRFCRSCGASTDEIAGEGAPTQMMPPQPEAWGARSAASTAPTSRPDTSPVYNPSGGYQPMAPPMQPQMIPPYAPPPSRSRLGWVLAFIGMGLFVAVVVAVMVIARFGRRIADNASSRGSGPPALTLQQGETGLTESNADNVLKSGNETILTKTYPLAAGARFSIKSMNGSVVIGAWDNPSAEVKVIRRGSDRGGQVLIAPDKGNLSIRTSQGGNQDVRYEIKLPRKMGRVELSSVNGSLKLSDVAGQITAETSNGNIDLTGVVGVSKAQTQSGRITAVLQESTDGPMEFTAINGKIDLTFKSDFDANLEASTVHGSIDIDDQLGVAVEKQLVGQHARGQIGTGGQSLRITTVNGSIKLSKQQ